MTNLEILDEYIELNYTPGSRKDKPRDLLVQDHIILRQNEMGDSVIYLENGNSLFIPWPWIDLFGGVFECRGGEVLFRESWDQGDYFESMIYRCTKIQQYIEGVHRRINGPAYLDCLGDICRMGTGRLSDYLEKRHEIILDPLELESLKKSRKI